MKKAYRKNEHITKHFTYIKDAPKKIKHNGKRARKYFIVKCNLCNCNYSIRADAFKRKIACTKCSLGLRRIKNSPKYTETNIRQLFRIYVQNAKRRNLSWKINFKHFKTIIKNNCNYCGSLPSNIRKERENKLIYNGLDRVNNLLGYFNKNVVPCCIACNSMKSIMSKTDFLKHIEKIYKFSIQK